MDNYPYLCFSLDPIKELMSKAVEEMSRNENQQFVTDLKSALDQAGITIELRETPKMPPEMVHEGGIMMLKQRKQRRMWTFKWLNMERTVVT